MGFGIPSGRRVSSSFANSRPRAFSDLRYQLPGINYGYNTYRMIQHAWQSNTPPWTNFKADFLDNARERKQQNAERCVFENVSTRYLPYCTSSAGYRYRIRTDSYRSVRQGTEDFGRVFIKKKHGILWNVPYRIYPRYKLFSNINVTGTNIPVYVETGTYGMASAQQGKGLSVHSA